MKKSFLLLLVAAVIATTNVVQAAATTTRLAAITSAGAAYDGPGDWTVDGERLRTASECGNTCDTVSAAFPVGALFCFQPLGGMPVCDHLTSASYGSTHKIIVTN